MITKACGRSALVLATGLFVFFAGPSQAATGADDSTADATSENAEAAPLALHKNLKHGSRHRHVYAHRKSHGVALEATADKKAAATGVLADDGKALDGKAPTGLPLSVANANAQLPYASTLGENVIALQARASDLLQTAPENPANGRANNETMIVAADQLNDVDRALRETSSSSATSTTASVNPPPAPVATSSRESSTWDETSLIGKIFIGFGALLTMASAARMFMA
jgi:hypothetical protein